MDESRWDEAREGFKEINYKWFSKKKKDYKKQLDYLLA